MPRPIANIGAGNPATYTLSGDEEFTVLAVTFNVEPLAGSGGDDFAWLDMRDPSGGIIILQPLAPDDGGPAFYSLAADSEPFTTSFAGVPFYPQEHDDNAYCFVSQRLSRQTLYGGCTLNVYKTLGADQPPVDPITNVSPHYLIPDLHLWVEDAGGSRYVPPDPLPPILVHEPEYV